MKVTRLLLVIAILQGLTLVTLWKGDGGIASPAHAAALPEPGADRKEMVSKIYHIFADPKNREELPQAPAGDIVALVGLRDSITGDTLCDAQQPKFSPIKNWMFPLRYSARLKRGLLECGAPGSSVEG